MTNFTLGRIGLDVVMADVARWDSSGSSVSVGFSTAIDTIDEANAIRQQLIGYIDSPDEDFVAVTWSDDPTVDGYYRVESASVTPDPDLAFDGVYYFDAQLHRIQGYAAPVIQSSMLQVPRTNVHGIHGGIAYPIVGVPVDSNYEALFNVTANAYGDPGSGFVFTCEGGSVRQYNLQDTTDGEPFLFQRQIPPAAYYVGAATLRVGGKAVVGRQVPAGAELDFELTNGLVRFRPFYDSGFKMRLDIWNASGSAWAEETDVSVNVGTTNTSRPRIDGPFGLIVLRNNPEEVAIRIILKRAGTSSHSMLDVSLRRGHFWFACRLYSARQSDNYYPALETPKAEDMFWKDSSGAFIRPDEPVARNAATNPKGGIDTFAWTASNGTLSRQDIGGGVTLIRNTINGSPGASSAGLHLGTAASTSNYIGPGQVSFGAWARSSVASRMVVMRLRYYNEAGSQIGGDVFGTDTALSATPGNWTQLTIDNQTAPSGTVRVEISVLGAGGTSWSNGQTLDVTWVQIIEDVSAVGATYWDGDDADSGSVYYEWEGEEDKSASIKYDGVDAGGLWIASADELAKDRIGTIEIYPFGSATALHRTWEFGIGMRRNDTVTALAFDAQSYMCVVSGRESVVVQ